jgi:Ca2+-binding EF-hand superfamily protein
MDAQVDHLEKLLQSKLENLSGYADDVTMTYKLNQLFRFHNTEGDGYLTFDEFNAAMVRLNFVGQQAAVKVLFQRYDVDGSGLLSYEEFSAALFGLVPNLRGTPETRSALGRVRAALAARGGLHSIRSLGIVMRSIDDNGNGKLDREELRWGLADFGVEVSPRDLDSLMNALDTNRDGQVDYNELLRGLRGNLSPRRRAMISAAFDKLDVDGSGEVTLEDVSTLYDASNHPAVLKGELTEEDVLTEFMGQWDTCDKDGIVTRAEFMEYYKDVSASVDTDDYFVFMMEQAWGIKEEPDMAASAAM